jgi:hypothetical protein
VQIEIAHTQLVEVLLLKLELHDLLVDDHLHVLVVGVAVGLPPTDLLQFAAAKNGR